jgi:hypothetical protein
MRGRFRELMLVEGATQAPVIEWKQIVYRVRCPEWE